MTGLRKLKPEEIPEIFKEIPQPPKELWIEGDFPSPDYTFLCVVGSRRHSSYGKIACEKLIEGLRGYPIAIVSGLAVGIDSAAHKKALDVGLPAIAFPGSGLKRAAIYPSINRKLADDIVDAGGTLVSEMAPDEKAVIWGFPMRNRLMAGISKATLVIEAEEKSGTLITARLALDYNRDVLAVPGPITSPTSMGTNRLIKQGATPITCSDDILEALGFKVDKEEKQAKLFEDMSEAEKKVVELLREPLPRDDLIRAMEMPTHEANTLLSTMEIKGLIKEELGEMWVA